MTKQNQDFVFLNPAGSQARHNRVQFMLSTEEYTILADAAALQGVKPGDLAGAIFQKHILPGLSKEVNRLRNHSESIAKNKLETNPTMAVTASKSVPPTEEETQPPMTNEELLSLLSAKAST